MLFKTKNQKLPDGYFIVLFHDVVGEELPEPRLHDEALSVVMGEVMLQRGNVGLESSHSESQAYPMCAILRQTRDTYPYSSDALQLRLRQVSHEDRGGSGPAEQHLVVRRVHCHGSLHTRTDGRRDGVHGQRSRGGFVFKMWECWALTSELV